MLSSIFYDFSYVVILRFQTVDYSDMLKWTERLSFTRVFPMLSSNAPLPVDYSYALGWTAKIDFVHTLHFDLICLIMCFTFFLFFFLRNTMCFTLTLWYKRVGNTEYLGLLFILIPQIKSDKLVRY